MVLYCSRLHFAVGAILVSLCPGAVLRGEPAASRAQHGDARVAEPKSNVTESKTNVSVTIVAKKATHQDDAATLEALGKGLKTIHNLQALFAKDSTNSLEDGAEKFANGALSEELSKKDSKIWSTIDTMIGATQEAMKSIKGKSSSEREDVMKSLKGKLDEKAKDLSNVNEDVSKKQQQQDEEYVLGLLLLHKDNWSLEQQLNATQQFMDNSPLLQKLYKDHDASKPLAQQLAAMMDVNSKDGVAKAEQFAANIASSAAKAVQKMKTDVAATKVQPKAAKKQAVKKAASAAARALFIQLADTIMNRDCPFCVAQCVDKCHNDGKPYVSCLTDCADAGK